MKKSNLLTGVGTVIIGVAFLLAALCWETPLNSLFCGFSGAFIVPGLVQIYKYIKWTNPKNAPAYQERLEQERIDLRDERKAMLRDKSGRYAYVMGLVVVSVAVVVFGVLDKLGVIGEAEGRLIVLFLSVYLIVQYVAGLVFYRWLERRY